MDILTQARESLDELTKEPIDITEYLKDITETKIISVEDNIREYLKSNNKKLTTLSEIQSRNAWNKPTGIKPSEKITFDDIVKMVKDNPNKKFSISDVWVNTSLVYVITKFNRVPNIPQCISNLNFTNGLHWEALDSPHYYLIEYKGKLVLCSTIGGHRATMCVLSNGYSSLMPSKITYIGSVDVADVAERCALIHHIDCNKRANQTADDRLSSGVEAKDYTYVEVMQDLIYCKLYVNEDQMKSVAIKGFRKCSSWQGFKSIRKDYGIDTTKYAIDMIMKFTKSDEIILTQAVETITCFRSKFDDRIKSICSSKDIFDEFMGEYFVMQNQSTIKSNGKLIEDILELKDRFNNWCNYKEYTGKVGAITNKHLIAAFGDSIKI